jgi:hypothetical protein
MDAAREVLTDQQPITDAPAGKKRKGGFRRAHRGDDPFASVNERTLVGQRLKELIAHYLEVLGHPTGVDIRARILAACELIVIAEQARFAALEKPPTADQLDQIVRLEASVTRALRRLGLSDHKPRKPGSSFGDALRADLANRGT